MDLAGNRSPTSISSDDLRVELATQQLGLQSLNEHLNKGVALTINFRFKQPGATLSYIARAPMKPNGDGVGGYAIDAQCVEPRPDDRYCHELMLGAEAQAHAPIELLPLVHLIPKAIAPAFVSLAWSDFFARCWLLLGVAAGRLDSTSSEREAAVFADLLLRACAAEPTGSDCGSMGERYHCSSTRPHKNATAKTKKTTFA
eukprot:CAMPEP_0119346644 /NCGR_PEP_ID=MMETSP1333-20130426/108109_1 /TAXON_ID=418940 /ORGANISM="Scyphosphaera apsteinii, Strain RCC1455" /LENGTH=200 /DNA_ID=CAMNT_0007359155 /DNA_START=1510 /DNA_END=2114 /DNA_ORIENTATION=-